MNVPLFEIVEGDGPVVAVAQHDGHALREEVAARVSLDEAVRLREEDPGTGLWTRVASTRIVARYSRFQVDLNRSRETAVYVTPEDAWGLPVWGSPPPDDLVQRSLEEFDSFYQEVHRAITRLLETHARILVLDIHSYNHRREGPNAPPADPEGNPEVNVGTGTMNREQWAPLVDRFIADLRAFDFLGRHLDVRENVKFVGRQLPQWVHETFPKSACVLALEFKKFFMDEWTGEVDRRQHEAIARALESTLPGVTQQLEGRE